MVFLSFLRYSSLSSGLSIWLIKFISKFSCSSPLIKTLIVLRPLDRTLIVLQQESLQPILYQGKQKFHDYMSLFLPGQRQNLSLKTTKTKTIEKVEQMLFDLQKIKIEQNITSTSTTRAISKKREEVFFSKIQILILHPMLLILKNLSTLINLCCELPKVKRFVRKPN